MENKNELSDIVLEKDEGKTLKTKRVLIIIAILIIIFLAVILSMKLFNNPTKNKTPDLILPPEPISSTKNTKKDEELFKQVPIIEKNTTKKDNFENIVKNLKEKEANAKQEQTEKKAINTKEETKIQPVVKALKKPITTQIKQKIKNKPPKEEKNLIAKNGTYIQVGATSKYSPNKKFLKKIIGQKLNYRLLPIKIKGKKITKILVGPFKNRSVAKQNMPKIKKYLNKHAFIYVVK